MLTETAKIETASLFALPLIAAPRIGAACFLPPFILTGPAAAYGPEEDGAC